MIFLDNLIKSVLENDVWKKPTISRLIKKMNTFSTTHQPLTIFPCIYQKGCIKSCCLSVLLNQLTKRVTCQQSSWVLKLSVFLQPLQYREFVWEASSWRILHIYIYKCLFSIGLAMRKEKRKSSNAFSLMILFCKDTVCVYGAPSQQVSPYSFLLLVFSTFSELLTFQIGKQEIHLISPGRMHMYPVTPGIFQSR